MKMDKSKLLSLRESIKVNNKAFKLLFHEYPQMIISRIIYVIWVALTPYVEIYCSAALINEIATNRDKDRLIYLAIVALSSITIISLVTYILARWRDSVCSGMYTKVQAIFTKKLLNMDFIKIDDSDTHQLISTIHQNSNGGGWGLYQVIGTYERLIESILSLFCGITLTITLFTNMVPEGKGWLTYLNSPIFIAIIIFIMLLTTILSPMIINKADSYYALISEEHNAGNRLFGFFGYLGARKKEAMDVRIYEQNKICEKYNTDKYGAFCSKGYFARYSRMVIGWLYILSSAISSLLQLFIYMFVCLKCYGGAFGIGLVTQYIASISRLSNNLSSLILYVGAMRNNAPFLKLVFDLLDMPNEMEQGDLNIEKGINYEIEFKNVSFKYPHSDNYVLKDINLKFNPFEKMAIVGENGSGKTTFIKLLCRLYDPTDGEILLNGVNIKKYDYHQYMDLFSVVFQDFKLLSFQLGENVSTAINYDHDLVIDSLTKAGFKNRLDTFENGLDTYLYKDISEKGINVSGGEAQKIAIARALYKKTAFIILDEPTAALDPLAEEEIYSKFKEIVGDKTAIYISHRLSSCRFCQDIVVFHDGKIIQRGNHNELLDDENGKYHELWTAQAQYYNN